MKRIPALFLRTLSSLLLAACAAGCASEGGVTGSGISAIVAGHVTVANGGPPDDLEVTVEGTRAPIDAAGNFEVVGDFSGPTQLTFSTVGHPNVVGTLSITIPAGSTTVLEKITVDPRGADPATLTVARLGSVVGRVQSVSCLSNVGVAIQLGNDSVFSFRLSEDVVIRDRQGGLLACEDLRRGDRIEATGVQLSDGTSIAFSVDLSERPAEPLDDFAVEFGGSVNDLHCDEHRLRVIVLTDADPFLTSVRGRVDTQLFCVGADGPRGCECEDVAPLDIVQVRGAVSVSDPSAVAAESIYVFPGPAIVHAPVVVRRVGCAVGKIETEAFFDSTSQIVIVRFDEATSFLCEGTACGCEDIRPDDVVRLVGSPIVASGRPFVDALTIDREAP